MSNSVDVTMTVNGTAVNQRVSSRTSLADFLRNQLELTGTHVGCEHGVCGACTVRMNGDTVRACLTLAAQADGALVVGLGAALDGEGVGLFGVGDPERQGAHRNPVHGGERAGEAVGLGIEDEVDVALVEADHLLGSVQRGFGEAERREDAFKFRLLGVGEGGEFQKLDARQAQGIRGLAPVYGFRVGHRKGHPFSLIRRGEVSSEYDFWAHPLSNQYSEYFKKIDIFQKVAESVSPLPAMV